MSNSRSNELNQIQSAVFSAVAERTKMRFPHQSLRLEVPDQLILEDLDFLKENKKIKWHASLKTFPVMNVDNDHPVRVVMYYRGNPVGYAFGGVCERRRSLEIHWMEKRNDAHEDLCHQFLGVVLDAYGAYAAYLISQGVDINRFAFVSPIEGSLRYYTDSGLTYDAAYDGSTAAMTMPILGKPV